MRAFARWLSWPWGLLTLLCLMVLAVFVVLPIGVLMLNSLKGADGGYSLAGFAKVLATPEYLQAIVNTVLLGAVVTTCTVALGVPLAYVVARHDFPLKRWLAVLPVATIVIPEVIVGQSWLMVLGNNGLVSNFLRDLGLPVPSFYGWTGLVFSMTLVYYTYIYLGVLAAMRGFDGQLEEALSLIHISEPTRPY